MGRFGIFEIAKLLMEDRGHLLVLGAYRDNEVSAAHPFMLTVDENYQVWGSSEYYYPATVEFSRSQSVGSRYADLRLICGRVFNRIGLSKNQR